MLFFLSPHILCSLLTACGQEDGIDFLFHTNTETAKTDELHSDPHVNIGFLKSSTVGIFGWG